MPQEKRKEDNQGNAEGGWSASRVPERTGSVVVTESCGTVVLYEESWDGLDCRRVVNSGRWLHLAGGWIVLSGGPNNLGNFLIGRVAPHSSRRKATSNTSFTTQPLL